MYPKSKWANPSVTSVAILVMATTLTLKKIKFFSTVATCFQKLPGTLLLMIYRRHGSAKR